MNPQLAYGVHPLHQQPPIQIPPPISPKQDPQQALTQQIDYYFSLENLIRDIYLRKNMDLTEGWVNLELILNFKRVKIIINGIQNSLEESDESAKQKELDSIVLSSIKNCENVEINYIDNDESTVSKVQLRVKGNFEQWLLRDSN
ncbi:winged helix DNA-binding domain-containing protein [Hyphopichia burtonii NRRL Y-1933]|uniref:Winged helix DNA-binding domain-containing protein n=1 Tax=Hyphopichia burtonii NRRL Y-1933 TaxID=984485 RepID=A0A1E4RD55_9ASCO|nr:winged helix DNA-binding domain-containing protein [Hyphopichia burtonii NRRL Y-1933]ODV65181.1 winged helix DNA-binding domain-containing protein [Hyphopichia burtonii NRRL Y-1933]